MSARSMLEAIAEAHAQKTQTRPPRPRLGVLQTDAVEHQAGLILFRSASGELRWSGIACDRELITDFDTPPETWPGA
jgi:hypothetical protein